MTTKTWTTQAGRLHKGIPIHKQFIYHLLNNRLYIGDAVHKGTAYPGQHEAIIDMPLWEDVQRILKTSPIQRSNYNRSRQPALLKGFVRCGCCGSVMTPSTTSVRKRGQVYRYYVCMKTIKEGKEMCPIRSVPAGDLEEAVLYQIKTAFEAPDLIALISRNLKRHLPEQGQTEREAMVRDELQDFDGIWKQLFVPERRKLLAELVQEIEVSEEGVKLHLKKNTLTTWIEETQHAAQHSNPTGNHCHSPAA